MDTLTLTPRSPDVPAVCRSCEARHGGVCSALTAAQLIELSKHSSRRAIEPGNEFIGHGENISSYSNILKGVVKLSKVMADGRQQIVGLQFAPDFMGRPFLGESRMAAEAATDTEICVFPRRAIERLIAETPELEHLLHYQALKELDEARDWMLTLGRKTTQEKVASFLSLIASHGDPEAEDKSIFELPPFAGGHRRLPRTHDRNRQPADDQAAQGRHHPDREQPPCDGAGPGATGRRGRK